MKKLNQLLMAMLMVAMTVAISACSDNDDDDNNGINPNNLHGVFLTCEGDYGASNGSISYLEAQTGELTNGLFESVNGRGLGSVVQSFTVAGNKGYIVVNNSQKVEVVDMETFKSVTTITDLSYPRYFLQVDEKRGFLTNGKEDGEVVVIDLENDEVIETVPVGKGPEALVKSGDYVYVANNGAGVIQNTVSVIDTRNGENKVVKTIEVGNLPVALEVDENGDVWVLCNGIGFWMTGGPTNATLHKISHENMSVAANFDFGGSLSSYGTRLLSINPAGNTLYIGNGAIYKMGIDDVALPTEAFIAAPENGSFYGVAVDSKKGDVYGFEQVWTGANGGPGKMYKYNSAGELQKQYTTGVGPNGIAIY